MRKSRDSARPSRRALAKEQTREALLEAALRLFSESGLDGPSLDAICKAAGRTRGSFYVHFASRDALVVSLTERILTEYVRSLSTSEGLDATLGQFARLLVGAADDDPTLPVFARLGTQNFRLVLEAAARQPEARSAFERILAGGLGLLASQIREGQANHVISERVDPSSMAEVLGMVLIGLLAYPTGAERVHAVEHALKALVRP